MRAWDYSDLEDAMDSLGDVPLVDEAFFRGFFKTGSAPKTPRPADFGPVLKTPEAKRQAFARLQQQVARKREQEAGNDG